MEEWSDDDALEDEEVDFAFSVDDYVGASTSFPSTMVGASLVASQLLLLPRLLPSQPLLLCLLLWGLSPLLAVVRLQHPM